MLKHSETTQDIWSRIVVQIQSNEKLPWHTKDYQVSKIRDQAYLLRCLHSNSSGGGYTDVFVCLFIGHLKDSQKRLQDYNV